MEKFGIAKFAEFSGYINHNLCKDLFHNFSLSVKPVAHNTVSHPCGKVVLFGFMYFTFCFQVVKLELIFQRMDHLLVCIFLFSRYF